MPPGSSSGVDPDVEEVDLKIIRQQSVMYGKLQGPPRIEREDDASEILPHAGLQARLIELQGWEGLPIFDEIVGCA